VWLVSCEFQRGLHQTNIYVANNRSKFVYKSKFQTLTIMLSVCPMAAIMLSKHCNSDFVITMTATICNAIDGFLLHKDLLPFKLQTSLSHLFTIATSPTSLILQQFHHLLPQIASIACAPSTPPSDKRITHFLSSVSIKSACSSIKLPLQQLSLSLERASP